MQKQSQRVAAVQEQLGLGTEDAAEFVEASASLTDKQFASQLRSLGKVCDDRAVHQVAEAFGCAGEVAHRETPRLRGREEPIDPRLLEDLNNWFDTHFARN